jgi:hypothetical protein
MTTILSALLWLLVFIVTYRFLRFITTPLFVKLGIYTYHSQMLFTVPIWKKKREIHLGTSYDFFRTDIVGSRRMLASLSQGLLALCEAIEQGKYPKDLLLRGTTYYFSDTTLHRFGFHTRPLRLIEAIFFSLNYLELCILLSLSKQRLTFVNTDSVRIAYCRAEELLRHKEMCRKYANMLLKENRSAEMQRETMPAPLPIQSGASDSLAA